MFTDFAPLSFYFEIDKDGKLWMAGGLIFHGYDGGSGGAPSFAVTVQPERGWSIHT
jgi:hypothetical protein